MDAAEAAERRLRRLRMRSWRRGIREMDLILGRFADAALAELDAGDLDAFEIALVGKRSRSISMDRGQAVVFRNAIEEIVARIRRHHGIG